MKRGRDEREGGESKGGELFLFSQEAKEALRPGGHDYFIKHHRR